MEVPIKSKKISISSLFGPREYVYQGRKIRDNHAGIDLNPSPRNANAEILAFADGEVTSVRKKGAQHGDLCYVRIKHSNGYYTFYCHFKSDTICVNKGDKVKRGQKLGIIGATGQTTGIHLHFQIDKGSSKSAINPYDYLFNGKNFDNKVNNNNNVVSSTKFQLGNSVIINGSLYSNSNAKEPSGYVKNKTTKITRISKVAAHPYNTTGDLGWMNEKDIKLVSNSSSSTSNSDKKPATSTNIQYYPKSNYKGTSITTALKELGIDYSKAFRTKIAKANGIQNYSYTAAQNTKMLNLLKQGKLKKV